MKIEVINRDAGLTMATVYWISSVVKVAGKGIVSRLAVYLISQSFTQ